MPRALSNLLEESEYRLEKVIGRLEGLTGYENRDIKFSESNRRVLNSKLRSLGLDPADTSPEELHYALLGRLEHDMQRIQYSLKTKGNTSSEAANKILDIANHYSLGKEVLAIKKSVIKKLLKSHPPKVLMKQLGYRSIDSMLKRESPHKIVALIQASENIGFNQRLSKDIAGLNHSDFEEVRIEFKSFVHPTGGKSSVSYVPMMGWVVLWRGQDAGERAVQLALMMLQAEEILNIDSFYLKAHMMSKHFSESIRKVFLGEEPQPFKIDGRAFVSWHDLYSITRETPPALSRIAKIHPALSWWANSGHLFHGEEPPVSFHLADVLNSLHGEKDFTARSIANCAKTLKTELLEMYCQHPTAKDYITQQLNDKVIALDPVMAGDELSFEPNKVYS